MTVLYESAILCFVVPTTVVSIKSCCCCYLCRRLASGEGIVSLSVHPSLSVCPSH